MVDRDTDTARLEKRIGYRFKDHTLFLKCLTHPSFNQGSSEKSNNQRLEFLGDAVLGLILARKLFNELPEEREGVLTRYRSMLVKGRQLSTLSKEIDLGEFIRMGPAEAAQGGRKRDSILEDAFEALIGAIYIDSNIESAAEVVLKIYGPLEQRLQLQLKVHNPKGKLQELLQPSLGNESIDYRLAEEAGPDHEKHFTVEVWIDGVCKGRGSGNSKKIAEEEAARKALESMSGSI